MPFIEVPGWFNAVNVLTNQSLLAGVAAQSKGLKAFSKASITTEKLKIDLCCPPVLNSHLVVFEL